MILRFSAGVLFFVVAGWTPAIAMPITITASGTLTELVPVTLLGAPWSLSWTIDSEAPDTDASAVAGQYVGVAGTTTIAGHVVQSSVAYPGTVSIQDGQAGSGIGFDLLQLQLVTDPANRPVIEGLRIEAFLPYLPTNQYELFTSDSLSSIAGLELVDFDGFPRMFQIQVVNLQSGARYYARGQLDSLATTAVPVPGVGWLLIPAFGAAGLRKRRTS